MKKDLPSLTISALVFDYGNTLIEFGPRQIEYNHATLGNVLTDMFGTCDAERLKTIRDRQMVAPYNNDFREKDLRSLCTELVNGIYNCTPTDEQIERLLRTRYEAFIEAVALRADVLPLLERLHCRYRLALLSNYPCGRSIRDSLEKVGLTGVFDAVVVSGEVGFVKPHRAPFETVLARLDLPAAQCLHIGDNWLADIQGAKRIGMQAVHITQHVSYENFEPAEGDHQPDARITHLAQLEELLRSST